MESISLKKKFRSTYLFIISIMLIPAVSAITISIVHSQRYDNLIINVDQANRSSEIIKNELPLELWKIVSGTKQFYQGNQYLMLNQVKVMIDEIISDTKSKKSRQKMVVAERTWRTLYNNVALLGDILHEGHLVEEAMQQLDEIRTITALFGDVLSDFIVCEIEYANRMNISVRTFSVLLVILQIVLLTLAVTWSLRSYFVIAKSIHDPIGDMERLSKLIASGDLTARVTKKGIVELDNLADNLNSMAAQINVLIEQNIREQKNLQKAQMSALQAQITPHFLYNTFDTIIWLAEEEKTDEVIKITRAFSEFMRISLSRGKEWITVGQEIEHVRNYLTIQKVRYADILNFEIEADKELFDFKMLKLSLQPLVENAIYHGIKNKRGRGNLKVTAKFSDEKKDRIYFCVEDNGAGFTEERLKQVLEEINNPSGESLSSVYGMYNVHKRLILYYNDEHSILNIESAKNKGTKVWFTVPAKPFSNEQD